MTPLPKFLSQVNTSSSFANYQQVASPASPASQIKSPGSATRRLRKIQSKIKDREADFFDDADFLESPQYVQNTSNSNQEQMEPEADIQIQNHSDSPQVEEEIFCLNPRGRVPSLDLESVDDNKEDEQNRENSDSHETSPTPDGGLAYQQKQQHFKKDKKGGRSRSNSKKRKSWGSHSKRVSPAEQNSLLQDKNSSTEQPIDDLLQFTAPPATPSNKVIHLGITSTSTQPNHSRSTTSDDLLRDASQSVEEDIMDNQKPESTPLQKFEDKNLDSKFLSSLSKEKLKDIASQPESSALSDLLFGKTTMSEGESSESPISNSDMNHAHADTYFDDNDFFNDDLSDEDLHMFPPQRKNAFRISRSAKKDKKNKRRSKSKLPKWKSMQELDNSDILGEFQSEESNSSLIGSSTTAKKASTKRRSTSSKQRNRNSRSRSTSALQNGASKGILESPENSTRRKKKSLVLKLRAFLR